MSWDTEFLAALSAGSWAPRWRLLSSAKSVGEPLTGTTTVGVSHPAVDGDGLGGWNVVSVSLGGQTVYPRSWSCSDPSLRVEVSGGAPWPIVRGTPCELEAILFDGSRHRVAVGLLRNADGGGGAGRYRLDIGGPYHAMRSRVTNDGTQGQLGYTLPISTTLTSGYTASSDVSLTVADTTGFIHETGGNGLVRVTPSVGGSPFYLRFDNVASGTQLDLSDAAGTGWLGTTAVDAVTNDTVELILFVEGHPHDVFRKIATSTGSGTNGTYDTLPASFGIGLPDHWFDHLDIDEDKGLTDANLHLAVYSADPVDDPGSWLLATLSRYAVWPVMRQGSITLRSAVDSTTARVYHDDVIEDRHIIAILAHHLYHPDCDTTHQRIKATTNAGSSTTARSDALSSLPVRLVHEIDVSDIAATNESDVRSDLRSRLFVWYCRDAEGVQLEVSREWSKLAPGDTVTLASSRLIGRDGVLFSDRPRRCMVEGVDWGGGSTVTLALAVPADWGGP